MSHSTFAAYFQKLKKENFYESSGAATFKSETSLTASLRSSRSGFLATSFDKSARTPSSDRHLCNGAREQCFLISLNQTSPTNLSWNQATEVLHQSNDIFGQTSQQYFDDTSNDSRSGPTMGVVTIPLPPPSTLTPTPPSPARRSMPSTMTPANPSCLTLASTTDSTPTIAASPYSHQAATPICPETGNLGFQLLGLSLKAGPLSKSRPNMKRCGPFSLKDWPRHHLGRSLNLLQGFCAYHRRILFQNLSFRLIPRSEIIIDDDLAKKAIWSMTSDPSMFSVTLCFI